MFRQFSHETLKKRITSLSDFPLDQNQLHLPPPIGNVVAIFKSLLES
jgi:hypothetical protein